VQHRPRKRFGQHFLVAPEFIEQIVTAVAPAAGDIIVEIGPGQAAITEPLAALATELHAIEFDRDLAAALRDRFAARGNVTIHEADALDFDFASLGSRLRVVGNLPYNISTPVLFHLLEYVNCINDAHVMLQKEVVDRLTATPGGRDFGRLTIMLGHQLQVVHLFDVPPEAFSPPPRVMSAVVRLRPLPPGTFDPVDESTLGSIVKTAFSKRRKTLRNALRGVVDVEAIRAAGLDPTLRPEQVGIGAWIRLANRSPSG
jgi:16S rRNA (adenine1518-N6/adenine1519-N6)-dimethyltransferase